jgi:hypothetical protein
MRTRFLLRGWAVAAVLALAVFAVSAPIQVTSEASTVTQEGDVIPDCVPSPATPVTIGNAVTDWNEVAQNAIVVGRPLGSSAVLEGIVQVAIYDATVATEGGSEPFIASPTVPHPVSTAAAIAKAACEVLLARVPGQATSVADRYDRYMAAIPDGPEKINGIAVGEQVADAILAWRAGDGLDDSVPYVQPPPGPGVFEPIFVGSTPVDVKLTRVRPLTLTANDQFRPDGPSPLASAEYAEDFNEVKAYGRANSTVRTPEQTDIALFWSDNTAVQWPRAVRALAVDKGLDLAETARLLTLMHVAVADSILACFDAKYHYLFWRPIHAIPRADTDGNPATEPDSSWTPLLYPNHPNHPEYPGAHGCWTTAVTETMAAFFGTDKVAFSVQSTVAAVEQKTRYYERFSDAAKEVYDARTWAGLHFRNSSMEGAWIGKKVARYVVTNFFRPTGP